MKTNGSVKSIVAMIVVGMMLIVGGVAYAEHNEAHEKANWTTTLNVKLALLNKLGNDSLRIDVTTNDGSVTLTGTVNKRETAELAETVTQSVSGVKKVHNDIKLLANEQNPSTASKAAGEAEAEVKDAVLETKVRIALVDKMGSDGFKIGTEAASGVLTLEFDKNMSGARRQEAKRIVEGVGGVTKVISVDKK